MDPGYTGREAGTLYTLNGTEDGRSAPFTHLGAIYLNQSTYLQDFRSSDENQRTLWKPHTHRYMQNTGNATQTASWGGGGSPNPYPW